MKNNRYRFLIIVALALGTLTLTYGFINKKTMKPANYLATTTPEQDILGEWVLENDPSTKIEFTADGTLNTFEDNILQNSDAYSISNECGGTISSDNSLFLKTIDGEDGTEYCDAINGINANNSNVLSLMTDNGKIVIYVRP